MFANLSLGGGTIQRMKEVANWMSFEVCSLDLASCPVSASGSAVEPLTDIPQF